MSAGGKRSELSPRLSGGGSAPAILLFLLYPHHVRIDTRADFFGKKTRINSNSPERSHTLTPSRSGSAIGSLLLLLR
jgi:hypothetical protein